MKKTKIEWGELQKLSVMKGTRRLSKQNVRIEILVSRNERSEGEECCFEETSAHFKGKESILYYDASRNFTQAKASARCESRQWKREPWERDKTGKS